MPGAGSTRLRLGQRGVVGGGGGGEAGVRGSSPPSPSPQAAAAGCEAGRLGRGGVVSVKRPGLLVGEKRGSAGGPWVSCPPFHCSFLAREGGDPFAVKSGAGRDFGGWKSSSFAHQAAVLFILCEDSQKW